MAGRSWLDAVLGLGPEWKVTRVEPTQNPKELRVECPHCGEVVPRLRYAAPRVWRQ